MRKIKNKNAYTVKNAVTGKVYSYGSSYEKAVKQLRLLKMMENKK